MMSSWFHSPLLSLQSESFLLPPPPSPLLLLPFSSSLSAAGNPEETERGRTEQAADNSRNHTVAPVPRTMRIYNCACEEV